MEAFFSFPSFGGVTTAGPPGSLRPKRYIFGSIKISLNLGEKDDVILNQDKLAKLDFKLIQSWQNLTFKIQITFYVLLTERKLRASCPDEVFDGSIPSLPGKSDQACQF